MGNGFAGSHEVWIPLYKSKWRILYLSLHLLAVFQIHHILPLFTFTLTRSFQFRFSISLILLTEEHFDLRSTMFSLPSQQDVAVTFNRAAKNAHGTLDKVTRGRENVFREAFVQEVNNKGAQNNIRAVGKLPSSPIIPDADVFGCSR